MGPQSSSSHALTSSFRKATAQVFTVWNMASTTALSVLKRAYCACKDGEGGTFEEFSMGFSEKTPTLNMLVVQ
jgi:hypothetical protein